MLRTIKNRYLMPELESFSSANDGADVTASIGALLGTYARSAAGINRLTLTRNYHRAPIMVSSIDTDVADGGYAVLGADPTISVLDPKALDDGGTADDGTLHTIALGWMSTATDYIAKQAVKGRFDRPRYIGGFVNSSATSTLDIGAPDFSSIATNGTGDYTLTFKKPFNRIPVCVPTLAGAAGGVLIEAISRTSVQIKTFTAAGAAAHRDFYFHVYGTDSMVEHYDLTRAVQATHVAPEIIGIHITISGGTPSLTVGSDYGTVADTGTGDILFTLTTAKMRTLIPIFNASNRVHVDAVDTDSIQILTTDDAASAEDATDVMGLILAYDNADEYYQG